MREALRYLNNAKTIQKSAPLEDHTCTDIKPVREAFATAYLAVLEAIPNTGSITVRENVSDLKLRRKSSRPGVALNG
ncbi:MAG: DUF5618 family protein [Thermodesulfobacteriota bacterium]